MPLEDHWFADNILLVIGAGFAAIGLLFFILGVRSMRGAKRAQGWPSTSGRVTAASIDRHRKRGKTDTYYPVIVYGYEVAGQVFIARRVAFGGMSGATKGGAQKVVDKYPPGTDVTVFYDPEDSSSAILEQRSPAGCALVFMVFLGALFTLVGLALLALHLGVVSV